MINETGISLPPEINGEAEILAGFIASFFIRYFQSRMAHTKTKSDHNIVKYAEYYKLANQYREVGNQHFKVVPTNELTKWGKANYRIYSINEILPDVVLQIAGGYSQCHDGYADNTKDYAEVFLLIDTYNFIRSFKKSTSDMMSTLKHEILHCIQMSEPNSGIIGKMRGMPKDKVMSKTADVDGRNWHTAGTSPHAMRDIEFKPNLLSYSHYIRDYLIPNYPLHEWIEAFKDIIKGNKQDTGNDTINITSKQLGQMMQLDKPRWKQFVKELYVMVFSPKEELQESMINLSNMLTENRSNLTARKGCLMAMISKEDNDKIIQFGKQVIKEEDLYVEDNEYGRETEGHVTIRYGFLKDLNELEIRQLLQNQKPFMVEIAGLDKFTNPPHYDVSVFKVSSPVLKRLNEISGIYLTESDYPEYSPHITIGYVKPNTKLPIKEGLKLKCLIKEICYSPIQGGKSRFNLEEGNIHHDIDSQISRLEQEWDRLDSMGSNRMRQSEIEQELIHLRAEKESQPLDPNDPKSKELWDKLKQSIQ